MKRVILTLLLACLATISFAQSATPKPAPTEAEKSFEELKSLAGTWQGKVTLTPPQPQWQSDNPTVITLRVTSRGNALVHEMHEANVPDDPAKYDHPVTMFYLEDGKLTLTHYCDAGNRPRMVATTLPDGKIDFTFADISGDMKYHMHHSTFSILDANHHIEEWTFMMGDKPVLAHFDLTRKN
jgi:hypothetical protein